MVHLSAVQRARLRAAPTEPLSVDTWAAPTAHAMAELRALSLAASWARLWAGAKARLLVGPRAVSWALQMASGRVRPWAEGSVAE